jgi:hypothetical protein
MGATHFSGPVVSDNGFVGSVTGPNAQVPTLAAADGAIAPASGLTVITKATAAALTLAAPTTGTDDGKTLTIIAATAAAHTVTQTTPGFNGGSTASDVATFAAAIGNSISLVAYGGKWLVTNLTGVTLG